MAPIFITGIGTGIGKTIVSAVIAEALEADYWKPVQAGFFDGTDSELVKNLVSNSKTKVHKESYHFLLPASPHIASFKEQKEVSLQKIAEDFEKNRTIGKLLLIEGTGGLVVPLNKTAFVIDLIRELKAKVILVSRNYLGSINHSLLTARACQQEKLDVLGWIFNDQYLDYESEIVEWSGYPWIASVGNMEEISKEAIARAAKRMKPHLKKFIRNS